MSSCGSGFRASSQSRRVRLAVTTAAVQSRLLQYNDLRWKLTLEQRDGIHTKYMAPSQQKIEQKYSPQPGTAWRIQDVGRGVLARITGSAALAYEEVRLLRIVELGTTSFGCVTDWTGVAASIREVAWDVHGITARQAGKEVSTETWQCFLIISCTIWGLHSKDSCWCPR